MGTALRSAIAALRNPALVGAYVKPAFPFSALCASRWSMPATRSFFPTSYPTGSSRRKPIQIPNPPSLEDPKGYVCRRSEYSQMARHNNIVKPSVPSVPIAMSQSSETHSENGVNPLHRLATFSDNRHRPIHRWYPFVEGYSADLLHLALRSTSHERPKIHDPFGGSGTTCLAAAQLGLDSSYCEINPFLAWLADLKTNGYIQSRHQSYQLHEFAEDLNHRRSIDIPDSKSHPFIEINAVRDYFTADAATSIVSTLEHIEHHLGGTIRDLARLAVAMTLVPTSNMIRRTDLRRRTSRDPSPKPFIPTLVTSLRMIADDLARNELDSSPTTRFICADVRALHQYDDIDPIDLIVTSPPYLNGTNYCRNTKLELLVLEFMEDESELTTLRSQSITAGINNVSRRRPVPTPIAEVEMVASQLDEVAYDKRIAAMVRLYFSDMKDALKSLRLKSSGDAVLLLDIGDSQFAGVHVPTHELLSTIAAECGWQHEGTIHLRARRSYSGAELVQVVLCLEAK